MERLSQNEKEDERRKKKALQSARKRSRSKEMCEISEEPEVKTRRKLKVESESISDTICGQFVCVVSFVFFMLLIWTRFGRPTLMRSLSSSSSSLETTMMLFIG